MDTRSKILTLENALTVAASLRDDGTPFRVVTGYFDVLQPALLPLLQRAAERSRLFAVVLNPANALLPAGARAELAAALRVIDYVIPWPGDPAELVAAMQPGAWVRAESEHAQSAERLIEHVFERHGLKRERRPLD